VSPETQRRLAHLKRHLQAAREREAAAWLARRPRSKNGIIQLPPSPLLWRVVREKRDGE
jgi:hypothetical protein